MPREARDRNQLWIPSSYTLRQFIGLLLGPLLFFLLLSVSPPLDPTRPEVSRMAAATLWIACCWITEAVPIPVTSLLPLVLFPVLGILSGKAIAPHYMNSYIFLFLAIT